MRGTLEVTVPFMADEIKHQSNLRALKFQHDKRGESIMEAEGQVRAALTPRSKKKIFLEL